MNDISVVRLSDVAELSGGYAFKSDQYRPTGHFILRTVNIRDDCSITREGSTYIAEEEAHEFSRFALQEHDTLFVMVGATLGKVGYVRARDLPALLNQNIWVIRGLPGKIDPVFLHYCFRELSKIPLAWVSGSARGFLRRDDVRNLTFNLPPIAEQQALGEMLQSLDDKIELNRRMNETLEATARAVFKDWFIDFGPTRAKIENRAPYIAADIWSLFPGGLNADGKPEGWNVCALSDIAMLNPESWSRANYPDTVNYVDLSNTKWGTIEAVTQFTSDTAPSRAQRILRPGDTVVGTVRPGNGSYAIVSVEGLTGSTGFVVLRPIQGIYREAVYLAATSKENIDRLAHLADGGAYPAIRPELVAATEFVTAPASVLSAFNSATSGLIDRAEANKRENGALAAMRDLLLPKLMSGEVRVKDAEKLVGEAV